MGTSLTDRASAPIHSFYAPSTWIEGAAEDQLAAVARLRGVRSVAAFPDLHPGKYGPVGCAILSDRVHPHLIGNDIGCGMSLFKLDLPARKLRADKIAKRLRVLEDRPEGGAVRLSQAGLPSDAAPDSLGSIGGGNHFCEVQTIDTLVDEAAARAAGLDKAATYLLVHSGSRGFGTAVFQPVVTEPLEGFAAGTPEADAYLYRQVQAVRWASLNRTVIAERAAAALRADLTLIADAPHNLIEPFAGGYLHRKGAAKADMPFVPLAGSRDSLSYLLESADGQPDALASLAHGAGRRYDRRSMHGRVGGNKSDRLKLERTSFGGYVVCEDRQLLIEEASVAYKNAAHVVADLEAAHLARSVAAFRPLVTFKRAKIEEAGR